MYAMRNDGKQVSSKKIARGELVKDIDTGTTIKVKVVAVKDDALDVELVPSGATTTIKAYHLSDHPGMWASITKQYTVGQVLANAVVVAKEGSTSRPVTHTLTWFMRPMFCMGLNI